jgi:hypothetical protein
MLLRFYRGLTNLYPRCFRDEFSAEMQRVFCDACQDAANRGYFQFISFLLREIVTLPIAIFHEHRISWNRVNAMHPTPDLFAIIKYPEEIHPAPWSQAILTLGIFLYEPLFWLFNQAIGITMDMTRYRGNLSFETILRIYIIEAFFSLAVLMLILIISWLKGFPRWCYPYWGGALINTLYFAGGVSSFGYRISALQAWLPLLGVVAFALLLTHSRRPLQQLVSQVRNDRTLLSFVFYGALPLIINITYDEVRDEEPVLLLLMLILSFGSIIFLRSESSRTRWLSLSGALFLVGAITTAYLAFYWGGRQESWMQEPGNGFLTAIMTGIWFVILIGILLLPAIIGNIRKQRSSQPPPGLTP